MGMTAEQRHARDHTEKRGGPKREDEWADGERERENMSEYKRQREKRGDKNGEGIREEEERGREIV